MQQGIKHRKWEDDGVVVFMLSVIAQLRQAFRPQRAWLSKLDRLSMVEGCGRWLAVIACLIAERRAVLQGTTYTLVGMRGFSFTGSRCTKTV